jgi:class 3 adenylate cyclase
LVLVGLSVAVVVATRSRRLEPSLVNVAAHIRGLSVAGAVMISGKVFDEIKNDPDLPATQLGEFDLKNVRRPVRVFAITAPGLVVPDADSIAAPSGRELRTEVSCQFRHRRVI